MEQKPSKKLESLYEEISFVTLGAKDIHEPTLREIQQHYPKVMDFIEQQQQDFTRIAAAERAVGTGPKYEKHEAEVSDEREKDLITALGGSAVISSELIDEVRSGTMLGLSVEGGDFVGGFTQGAALLKGLEALQDGSRSSEAELQVDYGLSDPELDAFAVFIADRVFTDVESELAERDLLSVVSERLKRVVLDEVQIPEAARFYDSMPFKMMSIGFSHGVLMGVYRQRIA